MSREKKAVRKPGNQEPLRKSRFGFYATFEWWEPEFRLNDERQDAWIEGLPIAFVES